MKKTFIFIFCVVFTSCLPYYHITHEQIRKHENVISEGFTVSGLNVYYRLSIEEDEDSPFLYSYYLFADDEPSTANSGETEQGIPAKVNTFCFL